MDSTYAPQSPDLSGFSSATKSQQPYQQAYTGYAPRSPSLTADPPPQFIQNSHNHNHNLHANQHNQSAFGGVINDFESTANQYMPPIPDLPPTHTFSNTYDEHYHPSSTMSSRGPRIKADPSTAATSSTYKDPNPNNIEIKTKFPVARIKRIMQADEEVGKVAQVTPVAVSKALELFMIALVGGAADIAREKGQKRVTAQHLKQVVLGAPEQFDFLAEIVGRVSEAQEGAGGEGKRKKNEKAETDSSEEEKKPKKGRGRRKKSDD